MTLKAERCEACKSDSPLVTDAEERQLKPQVADWEIVTVNNVRRLKKTFEFDGWMPAVAFANDVARIADEEDHHPTILIQWGKATVTWWTHAIKGLHRNDFIMAAKTDELITGK
jgi:4a-hydroxytetrahydrobiopterin dehydratase